MIKYLNTQFDERSNCYSVLTEQDVNFYLSLTETAYNEQGMISGQRDKLSSTSAIRIRRRMIEDFEKKAVFPPVVVGLVVDLNTFESVKNCNNEMLLDILSNVDKNSISIIDGMQRTTVFKESRNIEKGRKIRVEFWITTKTESLTYRMLVLNTGQVPWNLRRQIEVVYSPLLKEIEKTIQEKYTEYTDKINLFRIDEKQARLKSGQFHADDVIEMYLSYGLRKEKIDTASLLAEDFTRLDLIEAMSNKYFLEDFIFIFISLCKLDLAFENSIRTQIDEGKINIGRHIFDSMPAKIGFVVACSQLIYGRVGTNKKREDQDRSLNKINVTITRLTEIIQELDSETDKTSFFSFSILNEMIKSAPNNRIGDWQRAFYLEAFKLMLSDDFDFTSLESCWRAF